MSADNPRPRPFKVWSADRTVRKGVIANSLADLIRKGKVKLDLQEAEGVAVVLEADGTEVDDEYFKRLEENTIILLLKVGERWYPPGVEAIRAAIHAIPRIVCDAINTLELIDEAPSWKIMDNRGRVTVVLHWDQREIRRLTVPTGRTLSKESEGVPVVEEPAGVDAADRRSPILITAKIEGVQMADGARRVPPTSSEKDVTDSAMGQCSNDARIKSLLPSLRQNLGAIFLLSLEELELLADMDVDKYSNDSTDKDLCIRLRDTCTRIVSERQEAKEAMDLLQMWKTSSVALPHKRARHSDK